MFYSNDEAIYGNINVKNNVCNTMLKTKKLAQILGYVLLKCDVLIFVYNFIRHFNKSNKSTFSLNAKSIFKEQK